MQRDFFGSYFSFPKVVFVQSLSCIRLFETPQTVARQTSPSFAISQSLLKLMSIESMMTSNHLILCRPLLLLPSILPSIRAVLMLTFPMSQFFASDGQSIGVPASASVLPMNIQDCFPSGLTGLISMMSKGLSRVFSSTIVQKCQFFNAQASLWYNSHICTRLLEKPYL